MIYFSQLGSTFPGGGAMHLIVHGVTSGHGSGGAPGLMDGGFIVDGGRVRGIVDGGNISELTIHV